VEGLASRWSNEEGERNFVPPENRIISPAPYLRYRPSKPYTLALDLDETLVWLTPKGKVLPRPYARSFLRLLSPHY
jgi:hypothetical protein